MSSREVDHCLAGLDEPKWSTLEALRASIARTRPGAEQCLSYGVPGFRVDGTVVAGFAAAKNHLGYFPHSGSVLERIGSKLLVERLLTVRISLIE